tara:strand:+ start:85 stop:672 length:588 start_codon:yes stop_codon:yes gene_type:complete
MKIIKSLGLIFQTSREKQSNLCIIGPSNSNKTSLIADPLSNYFGSENIGMVVSGRNFKWQELEDKLVAIIDEAIITESIRSDWLKLTGQEKLIVEKKYSKQHIHINPIPVILMSNKMFVEKDEILEKAIYNRLLLVNFIISLSKEEMKDSHTFKNNIKNEEASIVLFFNKMFFKYFREKRVYNNFRNILEDKTQY